MKWTTRSGHVKNYILLNEDNYAQMQNEISSLQRRLLAMSDVLEGKTTEYTGKEDWLKRLGEIEDFVYESSGKNCAAVDAFLTEHDRVLEFIKSNPTTPAPYIHKLAIKHGLSAMDATE